MDDNKLFDKQDFETTWDSYFKSLTSIFGSDVTNLEKWKDAVNMLGQAYKDAPQDKPILTNVLASFELMFADQVKCEHDPQTIRKRFRIKVRDCQELAKKELLEDKGEKFLAFEVFSKYCSERNQYVRSNPSLGLDELGESKTKPEKVA